MHGKFLIVLDLLVTTTSTYKLVKITGHCSTVHGKFLIVLDLLVTTTSTDTLVSTGTLKLQSLSKQLGKLDITVSPLKHKIETCS